jgi:hypothetical protein
MENKKDLNGLLSLNLPFLKKIFYNENLYSINKFLKSKIRWISFSCKSVR